MFDPGRKIAGRKIRRQIAWQHDLIYPVSGSCINVITAATTVSLPTGRAVTSSFTASAAAAAAAAAADAVNQAAS